MKKIVAIVCFLLVVFSGLEAQEVYERRGSGLYFELFGNGVLYSINYETRLSNQNRGLGAKVGIAYGNSEGNKKVSLPVMLNYLLGKPEGKHFLEIGAGVTYLSIDGTRVAMNDEEIIFNSNLYGTFSLMYHRHPPYGGFMWKIGYTPLIGDFKDRGNYLGWVGIGLGYAF